jgi:D-glycero-D-manno-heptose 1,7-bisphosphate phosphatase
MIKRNAIFLDRDGTINIEKNYLYKIEDWEWIPGAIEAICSFRGAGYAVVIVTNQAGIARGFYSEEDLLRLNKFISEQLAAYGTRIDAFYHCPHHPEFTGECECRKPKAGMLLRAAEELNLDLTQSWMIGDQITDIQAAEAAGVKSLMVRAGYGAGDSIKIPSATLIFPAISDMAAYVINLTQKT